MPGNSAHIYGAYWGEESPGASIWRTLIRHALEDGCHQCRGELRLQLKSVDLEFLKVFLPDARGFLEA